MADTLNGSASGAGSLGNFIPEIWANTALEVLRNQIVLAKLITKDTDVATFTVGDILNVPVPGVFSAEDKVAGSAITLQNPSADKVTLTLNKHKEVSFVIEDVARAQANQDTVRRHVSQAAVAIAEQIETDIFGLVSGFGDSVGSPATAPTNATILAAMQELDTNKAPLDGRFLVVGPAGNVDLLDDTKLNVLFANSRPEVMTRGQIGSAYGFDVYMSQLVPSSGAGATGLAGTPEFGLLGMRSLPVTDAPGVSQMAMRDAVSGLVIRQTASYDTDLLGIKVTLDALYGVVELRDACGVTFHHAKT
jgi:hypothetical protein